MNQSAANLSQLSTHWSVLQAAHNGSPEQQIEARKKLLGDYEKAVRDYLRVYIHHPDEREGVFNEFAIRLLRGDFRSTTPEKGRFRAFVKTVLYHLVVDYHREQQRLKQIIALDKVPEPAVGASHSEPDDERAFLAIWRHSLMRRASDALNDRQALGGPPLSETLTLRIQQPDKTTEQLAHMMARRLSQPVEPGTFRRWLHLARQQFTDALVREVAATLEVPTPDLLADELQVLGFLDRCRDAWERWTHDDGQCAETLKPSEWRS